MKTKLLVLMRTTILGIIIALATLMSFSQVYADEIIVNEWEIPTPDSAPHDVVVDKSGLVWFTEIGANKIGKFDPTTEQFTEFLIPTPSSRPHGLVVDDEGNVWFTEVGSGKIGKLDPNTGSIDEFETPTKNSGPHTPIITDDNILWFTEQSASQIGKLDMNTGNIEEFSTITPSANPYGITVDEEGNAWFAELRGHNIGKVDLEIGQVTEYSPPTEQSGPRRIAIDSNGILWFTEYNSGKIASFDPDTEEMKEYDTSSTNSGPYAIWVDLDDNVWFSMTGIYRVGKFDQSTQMLEEYDLPSPQTHIKFIHTDDKGNIWFPNYNNNKIGVIMQDNISSDKLTYPVPWARSPLLQFELGTPIDEIKCKEDLELIQKYNGLPACVKPETVKTLIERKWAKPIPSMFRDEPNVTDIPPIVTSNAELNQKCATLFDDIIESQQESLAQCELDGSICESRPIEEVLSQLPISQEFRDNNCSLTLNDWSHISKNEGLIWSSEINWEKTIRLSNIFLMKPDSSEFLYYPNPEDIENRDAYETFMLIRLPEWLGGNVDDISAFRVYSALSVDDHCLVKYWPGERRQQIMNPCSGVIYRAIDGAMIMPFARVPGGQPIALPHLELSTDENGFLFIEPPIWSKTKNGVIGYGREITDSEIEQGSMFLINSFENTHPDYPGIPPVFAGMKLADIGQEEDEQFKILYSEFTPLAQNIEIYITKCDCDELQGHNTYEIETIGNTTLAIHGIKSGGDDIPESINEYHIWFAKDGFEYEVVGKSLDFIKNSITVNLLK